MDVRDRALLDLSKVVPLKLSTPRYQAEEARYIQFKQRVSGLLDGALGAGKREFLLRYFLDFLPSLLRAAAEHEGLDRVECAAERALIEEVSASRTTHLAHSPILFPLNRQVFQRVSVASPSIDLGIGNGQNSSFSLARSIDVGGEMMLGNLLKARPLGRHRQLAALDMARLPFPDGTFARAYALNCVYHVQGGRRTALEEISRVLAPGGVVALTDVSPFLSGMKPVASWYHELGFEKLEQEFTRHFLAGYGADGTPGDADWYRRELPKLGFEDVQVEYLLSPRLGRIAYLLYDWQALFNLDAQSEWAGAEGTRRFEAVYRPMLDALVAPLLKQDRELCRAANQGGYIFVTARKKGTATPPGEVRWSCPECRKVLDAGLSCGGCKRTYPRVEGIPLMTTFYADALREGGASSG